MKNLSSVMVALLSGTFLSAPAWATETVNTYDDLLTALADENADVILDMNGAGIDLDGGNGVTVGAGQTVVMKNIGTEGESAWTDTAFNIINQGTVAVDNIIFKDNNTSSTSAYIGGVIKNNDYHITSITNSVFDSNAAQSVNTSLWGGILLNGMEQDDMTNAGATWVDKASVVDGNIISARRPPDLPEYIMNRDYVAAALRTARDLDAGEEEWLRFVEELKQRKG